MHLILILVIILIFLAASAVITSRIHFMLENIQNKLETVDFDNTSRRLQSLRSAVEKINLKDLSNKFNSIVDKVKAQNVKNLQEDIDSLSKIMDNAEGYTEIADKINNFCQSSHQVCSPLGCYDIPDLKCG